MFASRTSLSLKQQMISHHINYFLAASSKGSFINDVTKTFLLPWRYIILPNLDFTRFFRLSLLLSLSVYSRGGQIFLLTGQISLLLATNNLLEFVFLTVWHSWHVNSEYFSLIHVSWIAEFYIQSLTQGPQKIFWGPHFGHPWFIAYEKMCVLCNGQA